MDIIKKLVGSVLAILLGLFFFAAIIPLSFFWYFIGGLYHIGRGESPYMVFDDLQSVFDKAFRLFERIKQ